MFKFGHLGRSVIWDVGHLGLHRKLRQRRQLREDKKMKNAAEIISLQDKIFSKRENTRQSATKIKVPCVQ